ncbi:hypothetical protein GJ496_008516 [Pomphorhynchus laevis]|nr:hypothetical protein GJ496_008516 [Pomphorhynchus laevis]
MQRTSLSASNPLSSSAMKRLAREAQEMQESDTYTHAQPIENNLFEWHFTIRGQSDTEFENGIYHGRLLFPSNYPLSPPEIFMLTPSGVFETDKKICLSMSSYHPETWLPSWSIRTGLLALIGFMPNCPEGTLGYIKRDKNERSLLAKHSVNYHCSICKTVNSDILKTLSSKSISSDLNKITVDENNQAAAVSAVETNEVSSSSNQNGIFQQLQAANISWFRRGTSHPPDSSNATISSFLTSTIAVVFIFFLMRNVYLWNNPAIDF